MTSNQNHHISLGDCLSGLRERVGERGVRERGGKERGEREGGKEGW